MRISDTFGSSGNSAISSYMSQYSKEINNSLNRIASGKRVANASEDATSYFRAQHLDSQARLADEAGRKLEDHISLNKSAQGPMDSIRSLLDEMATLASKAADETNSTIRASYGKEYDNKYQAIKSLVSTSKYDGKAFLSGIYDTGATGTAGTAKSAQISDTATDSFDYEILDTRIDKSSGLDLGSFGTAETDFATSQAQATNYYNAITADDKGINRLERNASRIQTNLTVLQGSQSALQIKSTNYRAASSSIIGVDDASESTKLQGLMIRQQAAAAFLAQTNNSYGGVMNALLK